MIQNQKPVSFGCLHSIEFSQTAKNPELVANISQAVRERIGEGVTSRLQCQTPNGFFVGLGEKAIRISTGFDSSTTQENQHIMRTLEGIIKEKLGLKNYDWFNKEELDIRKIDPQTQESHLVGTKLTHLLADCYVPDPKNGVGLAKKSRLPQGDFQILPYARDAKVEIYTRKGEHVDTVKPVEADWHA